MSCRAQNAAIGRLKRSAGKHLFYTLLGAVLLPPAASASTIIVYWTTTAIYVATDSKYVSKVYSSEEGERTEASTGCKIASSGPVYFTYAGVSGSTQSFVRAEIDRLPRNLAPEAALGLLIEAVKAPFLQAVEEMQQATESTFAEMKMGKPVLSIAALGRSGQALEVVTRTIEAVPGPDGQLAVRVTTPVCGSRCKSTGYFLTGLFDRVHAKLRVHRDWLGSHTEERLAELVAQQAAATPELVGGPAAILRVDAGGATWVASGACQIGVESASAAVH